MSVLIFSELIAAASPVEPFAAMPVWLNFGGLLVRLSESGSGQRVIWPRPRDVRAGAAGQTADQRIQVQMVMIGMMEMMGERFYGGQSPWWITAEAAS